MLNTQTTIDVPNRRAYILNKVREQRRKATDFARLARLTRLLDTLRYLPVRRPDHHHEVFYSVVATVTHEDGRAARLRKVTAIRRWEYVGKEESGRDSECGLPVYEGKYGAVLTQAQFDELVREFDRLYATDTNNGGILGPPGFAMRSTPCITFYTGDEYQDRFAVFPYVVSVPNKLPGRRKRLRMNDCWLVACDWEKLSKAVIDKYPK